ncbi:MAG: hypothetical protein FWE33_01770 [Defluviitaleaceae bacterium]|nr:hypothetical protein [Defluviitaleaceae bacterium]
MSAPIKEDKPFNEMIHPSYEEVKGWEAKEKEADRGHEIEKEKLRISKFILSSCGIFLVLFYAGEIIISRLDVNFDVQLRMMIVEPVRFVLSATIGYLFAIRVNPNSK